MAYLLHQKPREGVHLSFVVYTLNDGGKRFDYL